MARLTLSYSDMWQKVAEFLGIVASGNAPTGQDLTDVKNIVHRGLRQFLYPLDMTEQPPTPHEWTFLQKYWSFKVMADKWKYSLPLDYGELLTDIYYDSDEGLPPLRRRSAEQIKHMRSYIETSAYPEFYAIVPTGSDLDTGSNYELWLHHKSDGEYNLNCFYRADPLQPSGDTDVMVGGISAAEAILESCLAIAEQWTEDMTSTVHTAKAAELIQTLIQFDKKRIHSDVAGNLYWNRNREWPAPRPYLTRISEDNIYTDRT